MPPGGLGPGLQHHAKTTMNSNTIQSEQSDLLQHSALVFFLIGLIRVLVSSFLSSLYVLEIRPLSDEGLVKIFSQLEGSLFVLLTVSFALQKLLSFRRSHLFTDSLIVCATGVQPRKWSPVPMSCRLLPTFSSLLFKVVRLMLRSLIHLDLSFVHGD